MGRTLTAAMASGLLLQWAAPPFEWWWVSGFALTPVLVVLTERGWRDWLLCGLIVGLVSSAGVIDGGAKWGAVVSLFFLCFVAAQLAMPFAVAGWLAPRLRPQYRPFAFLSCWILFVWIMDEFLYTPLLLSAPIALHSPLALALVERVGLLGLEAVMVGISASVAVLPRVWWSWAAAISVAALCAVVPVRLESRGDARLVGVQPNIHWMDFAASGWSLERRQRIEQTVDRMTRMAVAKAGPSGTVVWPENGNGLSNSQLARRRSKVAAMLAHAGADLLVPGREIAEGAEHLAVFRFHEGAMTDRARKAHLLPIAESGLRPGAPAVIDSNAGALGMAICYDALFSRHMRSLVDQGAEVLIVTTDDTSFGLSSIPRRHLSYAVLRAAEAGRALLFVSNEGPSSSYDPTDRTTTIHTRDRTRAVYEVALPRLAGRTPAAAGLRHLVAVLALLGLAVARRRSSPTRLPMMPTFAFAAPALALVLGVGTEFGQRALCVRGGLKTLLLDLRQRAVGPVGMDALGPLFKQKAEKSCGAAALAFALTRLGDFVFEEQLFEALDDTNQGTRLATLLNAAKERDFAAQAWSATRLSDLSFGPGQVHILHMNWNHYVVVFEPDGEAIHLFDPAVGAVLKVPMADIERRWTRRAITIGYRPAPLESRT